jgi:hypothetical protein
MRHRNQQASLKPYNKLTLLLSIFSTHIAITHLLQLNNFIDNKQWVSSLDDLEHILPPPTVRIE